MTIQTNILYPKPAHTVTYQQAAIRIKGKATIASGFGHAFNCFLVESNVKDGIHHTRHGNLGSRTTGKQQGLGAGRITELASHVTFDAFHGLVDQSPKFRWQVSLFVKDLAKRSHQRKAGRNVNANTRHLLQTQSLTSQNVLAGIDNLGS